MHCHGLAKEVGKAWECLWTRALARGCQVRSRHNRQYLPPWWPCPNASNQHINTVTVMQSWASLARCCHGERTVAP
eukprot:3256830-Alexandrium_andersonii.AAC.1